MRAIENLIGKNVIIRSDRAGVFFGLLNEAEQTGDKYTVELRKVRRLWYWEGACSISQLAVDGTKRPDACKFSVTEDSIVVSSVIEIHGASDKSASSIKSVPEWKK